jgi:myosin-5
MEGLFNHAVRKQYMCQAREDLDPHVYSCSAKAFSEMQSYDRNQSILVSGESGAGKTETVKILMNHLAVVSKDQQHAQIMQRLENEDAIAAPIKQTTGNRGSLTLSYGDVDQDATVKQILLTNPLLESFGNAKTVRNDNSSRFGKYVQLKFDYRTVLVGAHNKTYLLEKNRACRQGEGEQNFHVFNQLWGACRSGNPAHKDVTESVGLTSAHYRYLAGGFEENSADCWVAGPAGGQGMQLVGSFDDTCKDLQFLGIPDAMQTELYRVLGGIVTFGELKFETMAIPGSGGDGSKLSGDCDEALKQLSALLKVEAALLELALTSRVMMVKEGGSITRVQLNVAAAQDTADGSAKNLYHLLFDWMVEMINSSISGSNKVEKVEAGSEATGAVEPERRPSKTKMHFIGLLDIFGFESFEHNALEQLCINYCNETLQQMFCTDVFKDVASDYEAEGIVVPQVDFADNEAALHLMDGRCGLFDLLNEECVRPGGSDGSFTTKSLDSFGKKAGSHLQPIKHSFFEDGAKSSRKMSMAAGGEKVSAAAQRKMSMKVTKGSNNEGFSVRHYAGTVQYLTEGWCAKNTSQLGKDMMDVLAKSGSALIQV